MTMANEPANDDVLRDVFSTDREDRGGHAPQTPPADTGQPRDERGRFASNRRPEDAPQDQQPPQQTQGSDQPPAEQSPPQDQTASRHVPLSEHLAERKKFQERIDQLKREADERYQAVERQLQMLAQRQNPPPQPEPPPDPFQDPEGFYRHQSSQIQHVLMNERLNMSEERARDKYGDAVVEAAYNAAKAAGVTHQFLSHRHPWGELVKWHKEQLQRAEIGDDLEAFKKKIAEEAVAAALANLKNGNGAGGQQSQQTRFPGTLAGATGQGEQGAILTPEAALGSVFDTNRNRRAHH